MTHKWSWLWLLAAAVGLYLLSERSGLRFDLTAEKRYTISRPVAAMLGRLQEPVEVTVLLAGDGLPAAFRKLANSTETYLASMRRHSGGKLSYRFVEPDEFLADSLRFPIDDTTKAAWLKANAIKQNEVTRQGTKASFLYPVALVQQGERFTTVNLLQGQGQAGFLNPDATTWQLDVINRAEAQLEYHLASAVHDLSDRRVPRVGYTIGYGQPTGPETWDLSQTLQSRYDFFLVNLPEQRAISDSLDVLLVVKPDRPFSEADKLKLDQYLMRGGNILFLLDMLNADMDSLRATGRDFTAYPRETNLEDLLFRYGVRINPDLVQDRQCDMLPQHVGSIGGQPQIELLPWPYFPLLYSTSNHPVSKSLDAVVMQFPNSVDTVQAAGIRKDILLATSNTSRLQGAPVIVTVEILKELENASAFKSAYIPLAVLLEGRFRSHYANRMAGELAKGWQGSGQAFLPEATREGRVLVTGDGDWVLNQLTRQGPLPMGANPYTQYQFANRDFLLNTIDYMTDESGIMASRSRDFTLRVLDPRRLESEADRWRWLNIGLPLLLLPLAGLLWNGWRRRRYATR